MKKKPDLNKALEAALNALDPLVNAYASTVAQAVECIGDEVKVEVGRVSMKKLREAKEAAEGLYRFYKCRG